MAGKKASVILLKGCVVNGENAEAFDEVALDTTDANYLIACNTAVDPRSEDAKERIAEAKAAFKAAKPKSTRRKAPPTDPEPTES